MAETPIFRFRNTRFFTFGSVPGPGIKLTTVESACDVTRLCSASKFSLPKRDNKDAEFSERRKCPEIQAIRMTHSTPTLLEG